MNVSKIFLYTSAMGTLACGVAVLASAPPAVVLGTAAAAAVALRAYFVFRYIPFMKLNIFEVKRENTYCWTFKIGNILVGNTIVEFNIHRQWHLVRTKMAKLYKIGPCTYSRKNSIRRVQILEDPLSLETSHKQVFTNAMEGNRVFISNPGPRYNTPESVENAIFLIRGFLYNGNTANKISVLFPFQDKTIDVGKSGGEAVEFSASEDFVIKYLEQNSVQGVSFSEKVPVLSILSCMILGKYSPMYTPPDQKRFA